MYRDIIEAPQHYEVNGKDWWVQVLHRLNGEIDVVNVYDEEGIFVEEFESEEDALRWIDEQK